MGSALFNATLGVNDEVERLYRKNLSDVEELRRARNYHTQLRIAISSEEESLRRLPWELIYDRGNRCFPSALDHVSVSRATNLSPDWRSQGDMPLRILMVLATPVTADLPTSSGHLQEQDLSGIDTLSFYRFLTRTSERCGPHVAVFRLLCGTDATHKAIRDELKRDYDVFYFVGHSYVYEGQTWFLLEDGTRLRIGSKLSANELAGLLKTSGVRFVFLSSCDSLNAAESLARFGHLNGIVAMQTEMPIVTAGAFDEAAIWALTAGLPIERCVISGRQEVLHLVREKINHQPGWEPTDRPDWAVPILFLHPSIFGPSHHSVDPGTYRVGVSEEQQKLLLMEHGYGSDVPDWLTRCFRPEAIVSLGGFLVSRRLVTNHQYRCYLEQMNLSILPPGFNRVDGRVEIDASDPGGPVVGITRDEAEAYCRWLGGRLPTADEWEVAVSECCDLRPGTSAENIFEWTRADCVYDGESRAVVVGGVESTPITRVRGFFAPHDPDVGYLDVGFRWARDL